MINWLYFFDILWYFCSYIGDVQLQTACSTFVQDYGVEIVKQNLLRNLNLHLVNLYDFGLVRPDLISRIMTQIYKLRSKMESDGLLNRQNPNAELSRVKKEPDYSSASSSTLSWRKQTVFKKIINVTITTVWNVLRATSTRQIVFWSLSPPCKLLEKGYKEQLVATVFKIEHKAYCQEICWSSIIRARD